MAEVKVKPSVILKSEVIALPPPDQFMLRFNVPFLLCFRLDAQADPRKVYWELRCGLSDALAEFPFFAGRVVLGNAARDRIEIRVLPDDGVLFRYNDLTASKLQHPFPSFDELEQAHFPASKLDRSLTPLDETFSSRAVDPCLVLQANFIQGGLLLAFCPHHSTSDMCGWTTFLRSWARHTAAAARSTRAPPYRSIDVLDRSPVFQTNKDMPLEGFDPSMTKIDNVSEGSLTASFISNVPPTLLNCYLYFSASHLRALKKACRPPNPATNAWISTNDALCALLWRHIGGVRQVPGVNHTSSNFQLVCNIRSLLTPPLPKDYVGNAVVNAHVSSYPLSELHSQADHSLYRAASAIRAVVTSMDERTVRGIYSAIDALPTMRAAKYNCDFWPGPDFFVTSLRSFEWYALDWGNQLGKLARMRFTFIELMSGCIILPQDAEGGSEVFVTLTPEMVERLRGNEEFSRFGEVRVV
ncbi:transferase [Usnea florida]